MNYPALLSFASLGCPEQLEFVSATSLQFSDSTLNFVNAADFDFRARKDTAATRQLYQSLTLGGAPFFAANSPAIERFVPRPFVGIDSVQKSAGRPLEQITDYNMVTEFKYG